MAERLDLRRLAKLLGMLGSRHDGEVVAAARKAHALVRESGVTWDEIIKLITGGAEAETEAALAREEAYAANRRAAIAEARLAEILGTVSKKAWKYRSGHRYVFGRYGAGTIVKAFRRRTYPVTYRLIVDFDDHGRQEIIAH